MRAKPGTTGKIRNKRITKVVILYIKETHSLDKAHPKFVIPNQIAAQLKPAELEASRTLKH